MIDADVRPSVGLSSMKLYRDVMLAAVGWMPASHKGPLTRNDSPRTVELDRWRILVLCQLQQKMSTLELGRMGRRLQTQHRLQEPTSVGNSKSGSVWDETLA
jgi:hypothetical protein